MPHGQISIIRSNAAGSEKLELSYAVAPSSVPYCAPSRKRGCLVPCQFYNQWACPSGVRDFTDFGEEEAALAPL